MPSIFAFVVDTAKMTACDSDEKDDYESGSKGDPENASNATKPWMRNSIHQKASASATSALYCRRGR